jgi:predicted transcriptional regulator
METWNSDKILDISRYYWQSSILHAAVKLDIFTVIGESSVSGKEIAKKINANEESVMRVANALSAMKLLHKKTICF